MNTTDIDPTAPPAEKRCTSHVFTTKPPIRALLFPGSTLSLSGTPRDPPAILFDAIYATTILHHFGTQSLRDLITIVWKDATYPDAQHRQITKKLLLLSNPLLQSSDRSMTRNMMNATRGVVTRVRVTKVATSLISTTCL